MESSNRAKEKENQADNEKRVREEGQYWQEVSWQGLINGRGESVRVHVHVFCSTLVAGFLAYTL